jgi:hypothetical protein
MNHGDRWTAANRTGGPVDEVFDQLRERVPGLAIERLHVTHPADDDNVYFIGDQHGPDRIQIDTRPAGEPPFLIENGDRHQTSDPAEASAIIYGWLEQGRPPGNTR